jgi:hypothetical protein
MRRGKETTEESKEGCLAGAVGSDHTDDLSRCDTERHCSKSSQTSKVPGEVHYFEKW